MKLVYAFDAYCGWSHGFSGSMSKIASRHPDLPIEVVPGGLFTGERRQPIRAAEAGFRLVVKLGVHAYPALLAASGEHVVPLTSGHATATQIRSTPLHGTD